MFKRASGCHFSTSRGRTDETEEAAGHQKELIWGLDSGSGLWQSLEQVPELLRCPHSSPRMENIKVNHVATTPQAGAEPGAETMIIKACLMPDERQSVKEGALLGCSWVRSWP